MVVCRHGGGVSALARSLARSLGGLVARWCLPSPLVEWRDATRGERTDATGGGVVLVVVVEVWWRFYACRPLAAVASYPAAVASYPHIFFFG